MSLAKSKVILGFSCLGLFGCVATIPVFVKGSFIFFDNSMAEVESTKAPESVEVLYKVEPSRPSKDIGLVEAVAHGQNVELKNLFPELQRQAALMNADAIYKIELQRYDQGTEAMHATAVAIVYKK